MLLIPWILTAIRGAIYFAVAVFIINKIFGSDTISWHVLWFGVPGHVIADFAGFCNVVYHPSQKPAVLGPCYLGLVALAVICGFVLGIWAGLLVFVEGYLFGVPGGYHRTVRELDAIELAQDSRDEYGHPKGER